MGMPIASRERHYRYDTGQPATKVPLCKITDVAGTSATNLPVCTITNDDSGNTVDFPLTQTADGNCEAVT